MPVIHENTEDELKSFEARRTLYIAAKFSPGNYQCSCVTCDHHFIGDKRAMRCFRCATELIKKSVERDGIMVVAAALQRDEVILTKPAPARHHDLVSELNYLGVNPNDWEQGFIGSDGKFLTRFQARAVALRSGQIEVAKHQELFSEDLW